MNNKKLGAAFEKEICKWLATRGFWVHFIAPDPRGAQPFDIIAVRNGEAIAGDCKTSVKKMFSITRLEENQVMAFEHWLNCGNQPPLVFVKYQDHAYCIPYEVLKREGSIDVEKMEFLY